MSSGAKVSSHCKPMVREMSLSRKGFSKASRYEHEKRVFEADGRANPELGGGNVEASKGQKEQGE